MKKALKIVIVIMCILAGIIGLLKIPTIRHAINDVAGGYTKEYSRTYSRAIGFMMSSDFDALNLSGKGIKIGVLDAGFGNFRGHKSNKQIKIVDYRDFTTSDTTGFFDDSVEHFDDSVEHGSRVCSNIAGRFGNDTIIGLAYNSELYLAKIDLDKVEPRSEEERMMQGIEWLIDKKVDIITSSINYHDFDDYHNYTPQMLDGKSSRISLFVDSILTANPDLIFVNSAGNEGDDTWMNISFPADVREVITVGAIKWDGAEKTAYSGIGQENALYIKPDVMAIDSPIGTSFSAPIITGLCAVLLGYNRLDRATLIKALHASGTYSNNPNKELGYGVPQTSKLLEILKSQ